MAKRKSQQQEFVEDRMTGRRWPLVIETTNGNRVRGFWIGEPHKSCFIGIEPVADKRGVTDALKQRVRAERDVLALLREAYKHPLPVDAETAARHRLPPSERRTPYKWGTLAWYRNELALAQDRIRLLERERDALLEEKRERDPVMLYVVNSPRANARKNTAPRRSRHADKYPKWEDAALDVLRRAGARSRTDKQLVSSVMSVAARGVDRRVVNAWWKNEGDRIRAAAQRRWPNPTRMFGSL